MKRVTDAFAMDLAIKQVEAARKSAIDYILVTRNKKHKDHLVSLKIHLEDILETLRNKK